MPVNHGYNPYRDPNTGRFTSGVSTVSKNARYDTSNAVNKVSVSGKDLSHSEFNKAITEAKESRPVVDKWRVDIHTTEEYAHEKCKCWQSDDGSTVAITDKGDIISVCKKLDDESVKGKDLLAKAVSMGGVKLDSFEGNHRFYTACGFEPVSWTPFNIEYAPEGWAESGCKQERVVFYKYVGVGNVKYMGNEGLHKFISDTKPFTGENGYDEAYAYRDSQIRRGK